MPNHLNPQVRRLFDREALRVDVAVPTLGHPQDDPP
jgi:hypothetical protein